MASLRGPRPRRVGPRRRLRARGPWPLLALLVACSPSAPPSPAPTPTAIPTPTPRPPLEVQVLDVDVRGVRLVVRALSPEKGAPRTAAALEAARAEIARVAGLDAGPELVAAAAAADRQAGALGKRPRIPLAEVRLAYALDRAAAAMSSHGMGDFYADAGDLVRADGSQDASVGRGWHATVLGADGDAVGTARLRGQALAQRAGASPACSAVAPSAVLALGARAALEAGARPRELGPDLGLRIGRAGGVEDQNPSFQSLMSPIGAAY
jgi:hypothetical protein